MASKWRGISIHGHNTLFSRRPWRLCPRSKSVYWLVHVPFIGVRFVLAICSCLIIISPQSRPNSTQENFSQKEDCVKCDWPTQIFRRKFSTFNNGIFGNFSVRGIFSWVEMDLHRYVFPKTPKTPQVFSRYSASMLWPFLDHISHVKVQPPSQGLSTGWEDGDSAHSYVKCRIKFHIFVHMHVKLKVMWKKFHTWNYYFVCGIDNLHVRLIFDLGKKSKLP
jgi:hypothetical protein